MERHILFKLPEIYGAFGTCIASACTAASIFADFTTEKGAEGKWFRAGPQTETATDFTVAQLDVLATVKTVT